MIRLIELTIRLNPYDPCPPNVRQAGVCHYFLADYGECKTSIQEPMTNRHPPLLKLRRAQTANRKPRTANRQLLLEPHFSLLNHRDVLDLFVECKPVDDIEGKLIIQFTHVVIVNFVEFINVGMGLMGE
jgi:hypothetical protein